MSYLTTADFEKSIRTQRLNQIIDSDSTKLTNASETAESMIKDYLNGLYDTTEIFNRTGSNRHKNVVRWCLMLAIYYIYDNVEDQLVPERVIKNYDDTIAHLEKIADAKISAELPRKTDSEGDDKTKFRWGSNKARSH